MNQPRQGNLEGPLMLVGGNGVQFLVMRKGDEQNPDGDAQLFTASDGVLLDQIKPIGVWLKFLYLIEGIVPPVPFTKEEAVLRVAAYKAAQRARAAAEEV